MGGGVHAFFPLIQTVARPWSSNDAPENAALEFKTRIGCLEARECSLAAFVQMTHSWLQHSRR